MSQQFQFPSRIHQYADEKPQFARLVGSGLTLVTTLILFVYYVRLPAFIDEVDNMWGGIQISMGRVPYLDFYSQHTPLSYYLSAAGFLVGADTIFLQRAFFYAFVALALSVLFYRNSNVFGALPLYFTAVFYVTSHAANPDLAYTFLSDQIQAIAYLFIFFELLAALLRKRSDYSVWVITSIASFTAVGVAFVSIYFVSISIFIIWIFWYRTFCNSNNYSWKSITTLYKGLIFPAGIIFLPFVLFVIYFAWVGGLSSLVDQAYLLNRDVYSNYIGGFGKDALAPLLGPFQGFGTHFIGVMGSIKTTFLSSSRDLLNFLAIFVLCIVLMARKWFVGIAFLLVMAYSQMRGWHGFHAQPYWAVSAATISTLIWSKEIGLFAVRLNKLIQFLVAIVVSCFMVLPYARHLNDPVPVNGLSFSHSPQTTKEKIITTLVPKRGVFTDTSLDIANVVTTGRLPAGGVGGVVPWFTDVYENEFVERISADKPVIVFHDPNTEIWGHYLKDFAPNLDAYITENYTPITMIEPDFGSGLWVRNSALSEALPKLITAFPLFKYELGGSIGSSKEIPIGVIDSSREIEQLFTSPVANLAAIQVRAATYARTNSCALHFTIKNYLSQVVANKQFDCAEIKDNFSLTIDFPIIQESAGQQFSLSVTSTTPVGEDGVTLWRTKSKVQKDSSLSFGKENIDADLVMNFLVPRTITK